jgi:eukaryotic-like serine/threonine-protein kinase
MTKPLVHVTCLILSFTILLACTKHNAVSTSAPKTPALSSVKEIDSFTVYNAADKPFSPSAIFVTDLPGDSILVSLPPNVYLNDLIPVFTFKGKSVYPESGTVVNLSTPVYFTVNAEDGSQINYTVIVTTRGAVYFGTSDGRILALDAGTGNQIWMDSLGGGFQYSTPQLLGSNIYTASTSGTLYGLDYVAGVVKWQFQAGGPVAATPTLAGGFVYFGCGDDNFYVVDLSLWSLYWQFPTGGPIQSQPLAVADTAYFGGGDGNLYKVNAYSRSAIWQFNLSGPVGSAAPQMGKRIVYIGSRSDSLYAVDADSGILKWSAKADGTTLENSTPTLADSTVYIGAASGSLFAFNDSTGGLRWKSLPGVGVSDQPFVYNNTVYVTAGDGNLYAVDAGSGVMKWSVAGLYANGSGPIVAGGVLYVSGGGSGYFYAIDPATGNVKWRFNTGNAINISYRPLYIPGY